MFGFRTVFGMFGIFSSLLYSLYLHCFRVVISNVFCVFSIRTVIWVIWIRTAFEVFWIDNVWMSLFGGRFNAMILGCWNPHSVFKWFEYW